MTEMKIGKGVYIWKPESIEKGNPEAIAERLEAAGVQTAAIKICDGFKVLGDLGPLIGTLRERGIRVGAWGYSYLNRSPLKEASAVLDACHRYEPDFYLINVESEVEGNHGGARMFLNELRPALAGVPLGLNTFWNVEQHPKFPWVEFMSRVDFVCPLVYWRGVDPVGKLIAAQQGYGEVPNSPNVPMPVVSGDLLSLKGVQPTTAQVAEFLAAADADPFIHGVLMWAADDTQTTPELWQAFAEYEWKGGGRVIPSQPLGWAKIKNHAGMWVRSSPGGAKVGALAKAELTPLWAVTETKWAALNQAADQWIFIGNPNHVQTTLDPSGILPIMSAGLELYQARVATRRGLNVRDAVRGRVLRALPYNTVVRVYEARDGWARINPAQREWVSANFLSRLKA